MSLDYQLTLYRVEDAFAVAMAAIGDFTGITFYKSGDPDEMAASAVVITANDAESEGKAICSRMTKDVRVEVIAYTHGDDDTRTRHGLVAGEVEATLDRSADQIVAALNAAAVPKFTAQSWRVTGISNSYEGNRRKTSCVGILRADFT